VKRQKTALKPCSEFGDRDRDRDARPGQDLSSFPFFNGFCSSNPGFFRIDSGEGTQTTCRSEETGEEKTKTSKRTGKNEKKLKTRFGRASRSQSRVAVARNVAVQSCATRATRDRDRRPRRATATARATRFARSNCVARRGHSDRGFSAILSLNLVVLMLLDETWPAEKVLRSYFARIQQEIRPNNENINFRF